MRKLLKLYQAQAVSDGDGVSIHRVAGKHLNALMDPFLMADQINSDNASDYIGGFPEHPHRGFETITYMKAGRMRHRDHMGNEGVIEAGDVQWMTAGKGVLHSEMPEQEAGLLHGFQVWLNLPAAEKMKPAAYREIKSASIPELALEGGGLLRVIAGDVSVQNKNEYKKISGVLPIMSTEPIFLDLNLKSNETTHLKFNEHNPVMVLVYSGSAENLPERYMGFYSEGETLGLQAGEEGLQALVLGGKPLREPIAQYGPFVMNSVEEVEQAIRDFRANRLV